MGKRCWVRSSQLRAPESRTERARPGLSSEALETVQPSVGQPAPHSAEHGQRVSALSASSEFPSTPPTGEKPEGWKGHQLEVCGVLLPTQANAVPPQRHGKAEAAEKGTAPGPRPRSPSSSEAGRPQWPRGLAVAERGALGRGSGIRKDAPVGNRQHLPEASGQLRGPRPETRRGCVGRGLWLGGVTVSEKAVVICIPAKTPTGQPHLGSFSSFAAYATDEPRALEVAIR